MPEIQKTISLKKKKLRNLPNCSSQNFDATDAELLGAIIYCRDGDVHF